MTTVPLKQNFLAGVGRMLSRKLESLGIENCAQLQKLPLDKLMREFGPKSGNGFF
jgi:nucleotidyltransferase/DNA polymerase involved in DNA repair